MKIDKTKVETVVVEDGYTLTVSQEELFILTAAIGKANFEEVDNYLAGCNTSIDDVNSKVYRMYCTLFDVAFPPNYKY